MNKEVLIDITYLTHFPDGTTSQLKEEDSWIEFKPLIESILWDLITNLRR